MLLTVGRFPIPISKPCFRDRESVRAFQNNVYLVYRPVCKSEVCVCRTPVSESAFKHRPTVVRESVKIRIQKCGIQEIVHGQSSLLLISTGFPPDTALSPELDEKHLAKILTYLNEHLVFESIRRPSTEMTPL